MHKGAMPETPENARKDLLSAALENARRDMLDLSFRNKLLHTPRPRRRTQAIEIVDEVSEEIFRILVKDGKSMKFKEDKRRENSSNGSRERQQTYVPPDDDETDADGVPLRHKDAFLQTLLDRETLQKKITSIARNARTLEEEQGVNTLFLAMGFLNWFEDKKSDVSRLAPLLLIPVELPRTNIRKQFRLKAREDDLCDNLSLQNKLARDFGIELPDIPEENGWNLKDYFENIRSAIKHKPRWKVEENSMVLGFFSFSKLLMYQDMDPKKSPDILNNKNLSCLLGGENFKSEPPLIPEDARLDKHLDLADLTHVLDADSSQTRVIAAVEAARSLVVQGPPGTGKSQTIVNLIAAAVHKGKKVIFLAEKMAALDVVYRRLRENGLSEICLELHSNKINKKSVIEELRRTMNANRMKRIDSEESRHKLRSLRDTLNTRDEKMHAPLAPSGLTPFYVIGEMVKFRAEGVKAPDFEIPRAAEWTGSEFNNICENIERLSAR